MGATAVPISPKFTLPTSIKSSTVDVHKCRNANWCDRRVCLTILNKLKPSRAKSVHSLNMFTLTIMFLRNRLLFQYKLLFWKLKLLQRPFCNHSRAQNEKVAQQTQDPNLISANTFSTREPSLHIETLLSTQPRKLQNNSKALKKVSANP